MKKAGRGFVYLSAGEVRLETVFDTEIMKHTKGKRVTQEVNRTSRQLLFSMSILPAIFLRFSGFNALPR
jgi:hypothetical protein